MNRILHRMCGSLRPLGGSMFLQNTVSLPASKSHCLGSSMLSWLSGRAAGERSLSVLSQRKCLWNCLSPSVARLQASFQGDGKTLERHSNNSTLQNPQRQAVRYRSNRSRRGLYDGRDIRSGNNVPFSLKKTRRKFRPNLFRKRVYSEVLDEMVRFDLTAGALRSIDKAGGLDHYLLSSRHVIDNEGQGGAVKKRIIRVLAQRAKAETKKELENSDAPPIDKAEENDEKAKLDA